MASLMILSHSQLSAAVLEFHPGFFSSPVFSTLSFFSYASRENPSATPPPFITSCLLSSRTTVEQQPTYKWEEKERERERA